MSSSAAVSCAKDLPAAADPTAGCATAATDAPRPAGASHSNQQAADSGMQHGVPALSASCPADAAPGAPDSKYMIQSRAVQDVLVEKTVDAAQDTGSTAEGEYCINLPGQDKAQLSSAIICDTLASLPVHPEAVSHIHGPSLEIHQVDDRSVDVKIVHSFRATYAEPLADVKKRAVAYLQQQHAAEAAAHPQTSAAAAAAPQQTSSPFQAAAAAVQSSQHHRPHQHHHHSHHHHHHHQRHYPQQHHHKHDPEDSEQGTNCICTELQDGEDQLLPHSIKRTACYVVHEREPSTDADEVLASASTQGTLSGGITSDAEAFAASSQNSICPRLAADKAAAASVQSVAVSPFQAATLEPFSLPGSSNRAAAEAVQQVQASQRRPRQQQQDQPQHPLPSVLLNADRGAAVHGGKRLSVEVLRAAVSEDESNAAGTEYRSASAHAATVVPPTTVHFHDGSPAASLETAAYRYHSDIYAPQQQQQQTDSNSTSSSGPSSSSTSSAPASGATVAVVPGPAAGWGWQQQPPVLVKLLHRKTAHGHEEVDVTPLHADHHHQQDHYGSHHQQDLRDRSSLSTYAADMQEQQRELVLHQQPQHQQQQLGTNQLDINVLQPPQGFVPLTGQGFKAPELQQWQQQQQQQGCSPVQSSALMPVPGQPSPTLMMPRKGVMSHLHPRAAPRQGFMPRCEWELDPRKILVGRRLAVGGFAEVFIGKYEGTVVAIKRLLTNDAPTIERFVSEVRMLARLRHPNLILFMGYCTMPELCIVSEYMSKGSLYSVLHSPEQRKERLLAAKRQQKQQQTKHQQQQRAGVQQAVSDQGQQHEEAENGLHTSSATKAAAGASASRQMSLVCGQLGFDPQQPLSPEQEQQMQMESLDPKLQKLVAISVARGMAYLHTRSPPILHLDLKSPNILVDDRWRVKITDFGLSRARQQTFVSSSAQGGTPEWMAPEVLRCEAVAEPADVYSYGVVLWELITGRAPWENYNPMQVVAIVGFRELSLPLPLTAADPFLLELCRRCLQRDPAARPTFAQIAALLDQHYGPPTWSRHAQPLMPPTPRPALPAPAGAVGAAQALLLLQHQQQEQQHQLHHPQLGHAVETDSVLLSQGHQAVTDDAKQQQQQQQEQEHTSEYSQQAADGVAAQDDSYPADVTQHVNQSQPMQQHQHVSADERPTAVALNAQQQVQPSPFAGSAFSPFAGNLAPWSVDSVRSVAEEASTAVAAAARPEVGRPDIASSTMTDSSRGSQQVSHSMEPSFKEQQPASGRVLPTVESGAFDAANANTAAVPATVDRHAGDSSSVRSEVQFTVPASEAASAVAAAAEAAEHVRALESQQEQCRSTTVTSPDGCVLQPGPACSLTPLKIGAGVSTVLQQQHHVLGDAKGVRCGQDASKTGSGSSAAAATRSASAGRHVMPQQLPPRGPACQQVAVECRISPSSAATDGPASAPAGHGMQASTANSSAGSFTNLTDASSHGQLPSDGSVMRGLWPSMTDTSLSSLAASRQPSRSSEQNDREQCLRVHSSNLNDGACDKQQCRTPDASCDAQLLPQVQLDAQHQQRQLDVDDDIDAQQGLSDCSRGNSPDTRQQQQQQAGTQLVYQVWPVVAASIDMPLLLDAPVCNVVATLKSTSPDSASKKSKHNAGNFAPPAAAAPGRLASAGDVLLQQLGYSSPAKPAAVPTDSVGQYVKAAPAEAQAYAALDSPLSTCNTDAQQVIMPARVETYPGDVSVRDAVAVGHDMGCDVAAAPAAVPMAVSAAHAAVKQQQQQSDQGVCVKSAVMPHVAVGKPHHHSVDASVLRRAAQQAETSSSSSSSYQKGRFLVSTTAAAGSTALARHGSAGNLFPYPLPSVKTPLGRSKQRSSLNDLSAVDHSATAGSADMQQKPSAAHLEGPCSLPGHALMQQQPACSTPSSTGQALAGSAPTAASAVATCSAEPSLGLMSAVVYHTSSMQPMNKCLAGQSAVADSKQQQQAGVRLLSPVQLAGLPKNHSDPLSLTSSSPTAICPTTSQTGGILTSKGYWGSQIVMVDDVGSTAAAEHQASAAGVQSPGSGASSNSSSRDKFISNRQLRGSSSPGALVLSHGTAAGAAGNIDASAGAGVEVSPSHLLHMHYSTGGLFYRTGRFSVTVQQQELHKPATAAASATAAAPSAVLHDSEAGTVVEAGSATECSSNVRHYQQAVSQQHACMYPSASCGALPYLAAAQQSIQQQQQQQHGLVLLSPSRQTVLASVPAAGHSVVNEPSTLPAGALSSRRLLYDYGPAAAGGVPGVVCVTSHPLEGEPSSSSLWSWESSDYAAVQQQQQQKQQQQHSPKQQAVAVQRQGLDESAVACNSRIEKHSKQQSITPALHQRRMLAQAPAQLLVPSAAAAPMQQQQQLDCQHSLASSAVPGRSGRASETSFCTLSSMPSISRTISNSSTASAFSPRSSATAAANPAAKPPLMPVSCKTPSPGSTPLPSPRPKAPPTAVARDYCRGRFQVHESPLVGPWQAWRSSSSSSGGGGGGVNNGVSVPYACAPCPTPVTCATPVAAACLDHHQQQQQQRPSTPVGVLHPAAVPSSTAAGAAAMIAQSSSTSSHTSPARATAVVAKTAAGSPSSSLATASTAPVAPSAVNATAAAAAGLDTAATVPALVTAASIDAGGIGSVKKLGRFTVKHESSSSSSKPGSAANSTHGSRAGSPRGGHVTHQPSNLGMSRHVASTGNLLCQTLHSASLSAASPPPGPYRSASDVAVHHTATAVAAAPTADTAQAVAAPPGAAATEVVGVSSSGTLTDTEAAVAASNTTTAGHHLPPIKTVSRKGRFVVTQLTPGSTACSTPKSEMFAVSGITPDAAAAASSEAAQWQKLVTTAAAEGAAAAGAVPGASGHAGLVITCPVCETQHIVMVPKLSTGHTAASSAGSSSTPKASVSVLKSAASPVVSSSSKPSSSTAAAAAGSDAARASNAAAGPGGVLQVGNPSTTTPGKPPRCSSSANMKLLSPSNTPRAASLIHTCSICGAALPSVVGAMLATAAAQPGTGIMSAAAGAAAATDAQRQQSARGLPVVDHVALPCQTELLLQAAVPQGLLAEAAARVLAARQQQQQMPGDLSAESSSSTVASTAGAVTATDRSSSSSIGLTAAGTADAAVHVLSGNAAVCGSAAHDALVAFPTVTAWQLPQSHPLQLEMPLDGQPRATAGSPTSSTYSSCYSSPVKCISSPGSGVMLPTAEAVLSPPAVTLLQSGITGSSMPLSVQPVVSSSIESAQQQGPADWTRR